MRLILTTVSSGCLEAVRGTLDEQDVDCFATDKRGSDEYVAVMYIPTPEEYVKVILGILYEAGLDAEDHVVRIDTPVDIVGGTSRGESGVDRHARVASAELRGKTGDLLPDPRTFVTMTLLRSVVAPAGVLLDSSAVVVGSMVLAPLFGPAVSARLGTVIDEPDLFWEGLRLQGSPSASRGARRGRTPLRGPPVGQPARAPNSNGSSSPTVSRLTPTTRRCARINDRVRERAGDDVTVDGRVTLVYRDVEGEISPGAGGPVYRFSLERRRKLFRPSAVS